MATSVASQSSVTPPRPARLTSFTLDPASGLLGPGHGRIAFDADDRLYCTDDARAYRVDLTGVATIIAGSGPKRRSGPNDDLNAQCYYPGGIDFDAAGNTYVTDVWNHQVLTVTPAGVISLFAGKWQGVGSGLGVFAGDGGKPEEASLSRPYDVAVGADGAVYIADAGNNRIRKVKDGTITTAVAAAGDKTPLNFPRGLAMDRAKSTLYICDTGNHRILKLGIAEGTVSLVAGGSSMGFGGDGGPATAATFNWPRGIAVDAQGNLFVADTGNHRVRMVSAADATITTVAGNGNLRDDPTGDRSAATAVAIVYPNDVACDSTGALYVTSFGSEAIQRVDRPTFSVPTHAKYAFGKGGFSVLAVISPGLLTDKVAGNLVSCREPYQKDAGGWALSLVVDPKNYAAGRYLAFSTEDRSGARQSRYFPLPDGGVAATAGGTEKVVLNTLSTGFVHAVVATRAADGTVTLYLDGVALDAATPTASSTTATPSSPADVTNHAPVDMDRHLPLVIARPKPGDAAPEVVRKVFLWAAALGVADVHNVSHLVMNPQINAYSGVTGQWSYTQPTANDKGYEVRLKGTVTFTPHDGTTTSELFDEKQELVTQKVPNLLDMKFQAAQLIDSNVTDTDLPTYTFTLADGKVTATSHDGKTTKTSDRFPYDDVRDESSVHRDVYDRGAKKAADQIDQSAVAADYTLNWDDAGWSSFSRAVDPTSRDAWRCVGGWHLRGRAPGNGRLGRDVSATANHLPEQQVLEAKDLDAVLPFAIRKQKGNNWCWAATTISVATFYDRTIAATIQGKLVGAAARGLDWSFADDGPVKPAAAGFTVTEKPAVDGPVDQGDYDLQNQVEPPLNAYGVFATCVHRPDLKGARAELREGRPVVMRIKWTSGTGGHIIVLTGVYDAKHGDTTVPTIVISDSIYGVSVLPVSETTGGNLLTYIGGKASWTDTIYTRPVWVASK